jgi:hypothetical protein
MLLPTSKELGLAQRRANSGPSPRLYVFDIVQLLSLSLADLPPKNFLEEGVEPSKNSLWGPFANSSIPRKKYLQKIFWKRG